MTARLYGAGCTKCGMNSAQKNGTCLIFGKQSV